MILRLEVVPQKLASKINFELAFRDNF